MCLSHAGLRYNTYMAFKNRFNRSQKEIKLMRKLVMI